MPVKTKRDEEKWQKAKDIAKEQGKAENYAYITGIYKKMKPDYEFKSGPAAKKAATRAYAPEVDKRGKSLAPGDYVQFRGRDGWVVVNPRVTKFYFIDDEDTGTAPALNIVTTDWSGKVYTSQVIKSKTLKMPKHLNPPPEIQSEMRKYPKVAGAKVQPDVQKMITAVGRMLKAAQVAFPGSKFTKQPVPTLRYPPGSLPSELEGRFVSLHVDLRLPQVAGNKARLEFGLDDAYRFFNVQEMNYPRVPILADGRYRLLVNPAGFNDRAEWDSMAKMLRPFKVAPKSNVDRTTQQVATIADKIAQAFEAKAKAEESEGPFNRMDDRELDMYIAEFEEQGPENFWMDGELSMSRREAYAYYRKVWRKMTPQKQKEMIDLLQGPRRDRWASERVASRYLCARSYQDYVDDFERRHKNDKSKKPQTKDEWESRGQDKGDAKDEKSQKDEKPQESEKSDSAGKAVAGKGKKHFNKAKKLLDKGLVKEMKETGFGDSFLGRRVNKSLKSYHEELEKATKTFEEAMEKGDKPPLGVFKKVKERAGEFNELLGDYDTRYQNKTNDYINDLYRTQIQLAESWNNWQEKSLGEKAKGLFTRDKKKDEKKDEKKAAERVAARYVRAAVLTTRDIEKWLKRQRTWFDIDDVNRKSIMLSTRENGDVGDEEPGRADIQEAKRLWKIIKDEFGDAVKGSLEVVDEWVHLDISLK